MTSLRVPALALDGLRKVFDETVAVDGLSLSVGVGTIHGLLGRNGAGKTTTLRMIAGVFYPDRGSISLFGQPWSESLRDRLGYLPEERGLYKKMRVLDQVLFFAEIKGVAGPPARAAAERTLRRFGLWEQRDRPIEELSKGNQQKVQLASVMVSDPDLLLLDEPLSGLDPVNVILVREILQELRARGKTIILSTHMMSEAERLCDEVCIIHRGKVVLQGGVREVRASTGSQSVHLEFDGGDLEPESLPQVVSARIQGRQAELRVTIAADTNALLQAIVKRVQVRRFEVASQSLEEVFVERVGEHPLEAPRG